MLVMLFKQIIAKQYNKIIFFSYYNTVKYLQNHDSMILINFKIQLIVQIVKQMVKFNKITALNSKIIILICNTRTRNSTF